MKITKKRIGHLDFGLVRASAVTLAMTCLCLYGALTLPGSSPRAAQNRDDPRKKTTVQTAAVDAGSVKNAVEVRYLNLPFGERTFGYIETGIDPTNGGYYSSRDWPIAHLTLARPAMWEGKALAPGDYVMIITPKSIAKKTEMMMTLAAFKPETAGGTFLQAGNVFGDVPKDAVVISQKPVAFERGAPSIQHLEIGLAKKKNSTVDINFHYGNRTHTEKLMLK